MITAAGQSSGERGGLDIKAPNETAWSHLIEKKSGVVPISDRRIQSGVTGLEHLGHDPMGVFGKPKEEG